MIAQDKTHSENLLKSVLESALHGIMSFESVRDSKGEIIDFRWVFSNRVACELVEKSSDELIGARLLERMPGNKESGLFDKYKAVVETGEETTFEQFYHGEDINRWLRISVVKINDGFTVTFQDISDLKLAFVEMQEQGKKYRKLFEESLDAIFLCDNEFKLIDKNATFQQLFLSDEASQSGFLFHSLFESSDDFNLFQDNFKSVDKVEEFETTLLGRDGRRKHCLINCAKLVDQLTQEISYLGVVRDLTRKKRADRELMIAEKLAMTGRISRTIAHEVRNPLTNVTLALEQLKEDIITEHPDAEMYFDIIERNTSRIGKLITDLLESSKPKELKLTSQCLNTAVKESVNLVRDRLHLLNMNLEESYAEDIPHLPLDNDQFKVALLNLMINSIEAMSKETDTLKVATYSDDDCICLEISDTGKGISKENLKHFFEPFFTSKDEGTGLGLVTVQNIVRGHGGDINVESEVGKGTTFQICFCHN